MCCLSDWDVDGNGISQLPLALESGISRSGRWAYRSRRTAQLAGQAHNIPRFSVAKHSGWISRPTIFCTSNSWAPTAVLPGLPQKEMSQQAAGARGHAQSARRQRPPRVRCSAPIRNSWRRNFWMITQFCATSPDIWLMLTTARFQHEICWDACTLEADRTLRWIECHPGVSPYFQAAGVFSTDRYRGARSASGAGDWKLVPLLSAGRGHD